MVGETFQESRHRFHRHLRQGQAVDYASANQTALLLLFVSFLLLSCVYAINRGIWPLGLSRRNVPIWIH